LSRRELTRLFGPAWIALLADAASIIGGVLTGKEYGLGLVCFVMLLALPLCVVQEAAGRLSAVTGKNLGESIRTHYSRGTAVLATFPIFSVDVFTYISEYVGIALGSYMIGPIVVGLTAFFLLHLLVVATKNFHRTERALIFVSFLLMLSSVAIAPRNVEGVTVYLSTSTSFLKYLAINVGAMVTPCMLIYQSSATSLKYRGEGRIPTRDKVSWMGKETALGALSTELVVFAEVMGTGLKDANVTDALQFSLVLRSVSSSLPLVFGVLVISAGFLALIVVSLSSVGGSRGLRNQHSRNMLRIYVLESLPSLLIVYLYSHDFSEMLGFITPF